MARYSIYDGGNLRNYPWESDRVSGIDPAYPVRYSAHLTNFHKVLRYHVDFQNEIFRSWTNEAVNDGELVANDDLVVLLLGQGTKVVDVVVQVKGVCPTEDPDGAGPGVAAVPPVFEIRIEDADGALVGATLGTVTMNDTGYVTYFNVDRFISGTHGFITARLISGDANCVCFGVMANVVQFIDPHSCECTAPCGADFPDPNCPPTGLVTANEGTGMLGA